MIAIFGTNLFYCILSTNISHKGALSFDLLTEPWLGGFSYSDYRYYGIMSYSYLQLLIWMQNCKNIKIFSRFLSTRNMPIYYAIYGLIELYHFHRNLFNKFNLPYIHLQKCDRDAKDMPKLLLMYIFS